MIQLFAILIGAGFTIIGLLFVDYGLPRTTTLVCERFQVQLITCRQSVAVAGIPTQSHRLEDVQRIQMESFQVSSDEGDINVPRYQILLTGSQSQLTFGLTSNPEELQPTLERLTHFQSGSSPNSISVSGSQAAWLHFGVGGLVTLLGLWLVIASIRSTLKPKERQI
ncbi:hypothetical protein IFO70_39670 [Phormidium tenue FACHB-886]|nr:hypothetical protein [Phormidium tenue FACHB-886]